MADWTVCPHCHLKHTRRADGTCPKCKQSVEQEPPEPAAPQATRTGLPDVYDGSVPPRAGIREPEATALAPSKAIPLGARIGGGILVVNALSSGIETVVFQTAQPEAVQGLSSGSALFDLIVGGLVLAGVVPMLTWARVRVTLGALILPPLLLVLTGSGLFAAFQLAFSVGLLLLLFGDAGRGRIGAGLTLAALCVGLNGVVLVGLARGSNPVAYFVMRSQLEPGGPVSRVDGATLSYHLTAPAEGWYVRTKEAAHKDNPLADRWLVRPDKDAHVMVVAETLPGDARIDIETFSKAVMDNARGAASRFEVVEQSDMPTRLQGARLVHARGVIDKISVEAYYGIFVQDQYAFQVMAFTTQRSFPGVKADLHEIVTSFTFP